MQVGESLAELDNLSTLVSSFLKPTFPSCCPTTPAISPPELAKRSSTKPTISWKGVRQLVNAFVSFIWSRNFSVVAAAAESAAAEFFPRVSHMTVSSKKSLAVMRQVLRNESCCCGRSGAGNNQRKIFLKDQVQCNKMRGLKGRGRSIDVFSKTNIRSTTTLVGEQAKGMRAASHL